MHAARNIASALLATALIAGCTSDADEDSPQEVGTTETSDEDDQDTED